jgi:pyruvate/2-oxoglutarate dehydrogenase complex dihydrolipoamide acyltransferase (E2) component
MPQVGAEVNVGARISGRLEKLYVNVGDSVVKGQVIAEIEKEDLEAMKAVAEADVTLIQVRLTALKTEVPRRLPKRKPRWPNRRPGWNSLNANWGGMTAFWEVPHLKGGLGRSVQRF